MKTFSQLKKDLKEGTKVKTIYNYCKPENNGQIRSIGKVQTNAIAFLRDDNKLSWLWWEKASLYEYDGNIFKCYYQDTNGNRQLAFIYEIIY